MSLTLEIDPRRVKGVRDPMLYGHFLEHFHRQVYGGVFDPGNPLSDEDGFRTDVIEAMKKIRVPVDASFPRITGPTASGKSGLRFLTRPGGWRIPTPSAPMNS